MVGRHGQEAWLESVLELSQSDLWEADSVTLGEKKKKAELTSLLGDCLDSCPLVT